MERKDIKDRRILTLAAEVAETRDRKLPDILLGIKGIIRPVAISTTFISLLVLFVSDIHVKAYSFQLDF